MQIIVTCGAGEGVTRLAAFDAALLDAGVAHYNIIRLSSIIPPGSSIVRSNFVASESEYGDRLYVVMAEGFQVSDGREAWAGLAWGQESATKRGLFVESSGKNSMDVERSLVTTFEAIKTGRNEPFDSLETETVGRECCGSPVCALVIAVYGSESW